MTDKYSVLIIDSNPEDLMPLICFMEDQYELLVAPEQSNYVDFAQNACPDIILVDDMISDPNCYDICQDLKSTSGTDQVPVILMSDLSDEELRRDINYLSVDGYICKPFNKNELLKKVSTLLSVH